MSDWTFPSEILCPLDRPSLPHRETRLVDYYRAKRQLIKECEPERILEFGIRAGYSAWTFLTACPGATYVGVDNEQGERDPLFGHARFSNLSTLLLSSLIAVHYSLRIF